MKTLAGSTRVLRSLLDEGPATATELARRLELTPAMVRRHLDELLADGDVAPSDRAPFGPVGQRGRGRPARVYSMTSQGRGVFDQEYDDVAVGALRFLADRDGDDAVLEFARQRVSELERRYRPVVDSVADASRRVAVLAAALTADGYAASVTPASSTADQLCQHHCPVAHVAEEFPQFCEAETEAFERLLGSHVTRLATIGHGDGVCTTHVPRVTTSVGRNAS
ncbi:MAG: transcriptional regulator [Actinobacteria bacterium]|nr:transcriptional regulator [Actinomycetota bacterium]